MSKSSPGNGCAYAAMAPLQLPHHWSAEQALAVWEFLDEIAGFVWERYELQLLELIRDEFPQEDRYQHDISQLDLFDPDDDIPF